MRDNIRMIKSLISENSNIINDLNKKALSKDISKEDLEKLTKAIVKLSKANKHYNKALKLISGVKTKEVKKTVKKVESCKKAEVDFTEIKDVDIEKTVGNLPINATIKCKGKFNCNLVINVNKSITLKSGSIICIGYMPKESKANWVCLRRKMIKNGELVKKHMDDFKQAKYITERDVTFESEASLKRFILGRDINASDSSVSIMVGNTTLDRYIKIGNN